jgi:hypothetical protein
MGHGKGGGCMGWFWKSQGGELAGEYILVFVNLTRFSPGRLI